MREELAGYPQQLFPMASQLVCLLVVGAEDLEALHIIHSLKY